MAAGTPISIPSFGPFLGPPSDLNSTNTTEDQSAQLDRIKRQFLAALNHEIRTPLSGILGMTNLLEQSNLTVEQKEYVHLTKACAEELNQVLSSALEYTSMTAGEIHVDHSDFLLHEAIEALAAYWLVKARQKGVQLLLHVDAEVPETAKGDELRFRKLLSHLLSNAVKFTEHGQIDLRVGCQADPEDPAQFVLEVSVIDTGIGIAPEQMQRIFDCFEQLESGLGRRYPGLGLGLSLARGLCSQLGGELIVDSHSGQGSTFAFSIPMGYSLLEPTYLSPEPKRVLVVDDNEAARKVAAAYLKRGGYSVTLACSGEEALDLASEFRFDLVLMDLQMPGMDGIDTTTQLRGVQGYERTPVVALTANAGDEYRLLCLSQGMQGYLPKPVESDTLLSTIRRLL
jgi:CheY-like chemotaxis protein/nitrogen-specific signal transduction histidine kinase